MSPISRGLGVGVLMALGSRLLAELSAPLVGPLVMLLVVSLLLDFFWWRRY
jgi:hypothetical protein